MEIFSKIVLILVEDIQKSPTPFVISIVATLISFFSYRISSKALSNSKKRIIEEDVLKSTEKKSSLLRNLQDSQVYAKNAQKEIIDIEFNINSLISLIGKEPPKDKEGAITKTMESLSNHKSILNNLEKEIKEKYKTIEEMRIGPDPKIFELRTPEVTAIKNESMIRLSRAESLQTDVRKYYDLFFKEYIDTLKQKNKIAF